MLTFQKDLINIITTSHEEYIKKYNNLINNQNLTNELSIEEAQVILDHVKNFNKNINSLCKIIDNINDIKINKSIEEKIEKELFIKILPIMCIYRTLLYEKYNQKKKFYNIENNNLENIVNSNSNIEEND
jgi:maltooligosyltrehalose synthase